VKIVEIGKTALVHVEKFLDLLEAQLWRAANGGIGAVAGGRFIIDAEAKLPARPFRQRFGKAQHPARL
jgi:hypothetical protein